jgi:GntR family transcriptional regulator
MSIPTLLHIDPSAASPIWRQIEDGVRRLVVSGRLAEGAAVPSVRELAKALRVNPATVSKAYRRLTDSNLLMVRRGEGTFVAGLSESRRETDRQRLLAEGASEYVRIATSVGADLEAAVRTVRDGWRAMEDGGGEGTGDER